MWNPETPPFVRVDLPNAFEITEFSPHMVKSFSNYLSKLYANSVPICVLNINSCGGDADCLYSCISLMAEYRKRGLEFCGVVPGFAYSAGAIMFLFCNEGRRFMGETATTMLHQLQMGSGHDRLSSHRVNVETAQIQQNALFETISKHLKKKKDWLTNQLKSKNHEDWYLSAKDAAALGLAEIGLPTFNMRVQCQFSVNL